MALKTLPQLRQMVKEPQLLHRWEISVPTWPKVGSPSNPDALFFITTSDLPEEEDEKAKVNLGGFELQYNGKTNRAGELNWTFFDNTERAILKYFFIDYPNFKQKSTDINSVSLQSSDTSDLLVPVVNMSLYNAAGTTVTTTYQLMNCLFSPGTSGELGQDPEAMKPTVKVSFDWWIIK